MIPNIVRNTVIVGVVVLLVAGVALFRHRMPAPTEGETPVPASAGEAAATQPGALPLMIDLGADKCIPCKKMAPILAELKAAYAGRAEIEFFDVWKNPGAGQPYGVRVIPTQIFLDRDGNEVWRHEGFLGKDEIVAKLKTRGAL